MNYVPINYSKWDFTGKGKNIEISLSNQEKFIWDSALTYQDSRRGERGHGECVTYFALKLASLLKGDKKIIIPAAILHDLGWSQLTEVERELFYQEKDDGFGKKIWERYEPTLRIRHQEQGVLLSKKILQKVDYNSQHISEILEIISQHDTRKEFFNKNDGIMRDADKLWRFTLPNWNMGIKERNLDPKIFYKSLTDYFSKKGFFYSNMSKEIAEIELSNSLDYYNKSL